MPFDAHRGCHCRSGDVVISDVLVASLTPSGQELAAAVDWEQQPQYELDAAIADDGSVLATVRMSLPVGEAAAEAPLRWFGGCGR